MMTRMPDLVKNIPPEFLVLYRERDYQEMEAPVLRPESLAYGKKHFLPEMPPPRKVVMENPNKKKKEKQIKKKDKEYAARGIAGFIITREGFKYEVAWDKFEE